MEGKLASSTNRMLKEFLISFLFRALGVLSYVILVGYPPFYDNAPLRLKTKIIRGIYEFHPEYWTKVSDEAKDFVTRLLTVDMSARMTAEQALLHPWVRMRYGTFSLKLEKCTERHHTYFNFQLRAINIQIVFLFLKFNIAIGLASCS